MKFLKKLGGILLTFLPFIVTMGIQLLISLPVTFYYYLIVMSTNELPATFEGIMEWLMYDMIYGDYGVVVTICWGIASMITFMLWYRKQQKTRTSVPLKQSVNITSIAGLVLMVFGLQVSIQYFYTCLEMMRPEWFVEYNQMMNFANYSYPAMIAMTLYSIFIAPIHEEFLIRGVTQNFAQKAMPFWIANILQAVIFGVLHMNLIQGSYAFLVGLLLGYIMYKCKNIWIPIIFHFLFNLFGNIIPLRFLNSNASSAYTLVIIIGVSIMCAGILLFEVSINNRDVALGIKQKN